PSQLRLRCHVPSQQRPPPPFPLVFSSMTPRPPRSTLFPYTTLFRSVYNDTFEAVEDVNHVLQGRRADVVVLAPATANSIAKAAAGLAEDLLGNILLTATVPIVMAPAMHTEMWENPATKANVATLRTRGVHVIEPAVGRLTGVDTGKGRFPEPEDIWA